MPRFNERRIQWMDVIGRFEEQPSSMHTRNALGCIGRLRDEGARYWNKDSKQLSRWQEGCDDLWSFVNRLGERRDIKSDSLETVMREFIQEFEHAEMRMYQMLYGTIEDPDRSQEVKDMMAWFDLVFQTSTYALVSTWIPDKQEQKTMAISVNLMTGKSCTKVTGSEMQVPKKYKRATKRL